MRNPECFRCATLRWLSQSEQDGIIVGERKIFSFGVFNSELARRAASTVRVCQSIFILETTGKFIEHTARETDRPIVHDDTSKSDRESLNRQRFETGDKLFGPIERRHNNQKKELCGSFLRSQLSLQPHLLWVTRL